MDAPHARINVSLCRAFSVTARGVSREPLFLRGGRIDGSPSARAYQVNLRDHLIFPGLINAHEHLHLNAVPPLQAKTPFPNSYAWIEAFQSHFKHDGVIAALRIPKTLRLRHGGLKNLLAGTTCVAHHDPLDPSLCGPEFPVTVLRDYGWSYALGWPDYGPPVRQSFTDTPSDWPWMIHLAEGTDAVAHAELSQLDQLGCLAANSVLVHGVGLREQDVDRVVGSGAAIVWCPASNHHLLGRTLDPHHLCAAGRLALGTDSRLSGARDMLDEMRGIMVRDELGASHLLALATTCASRILRLSLHGSLSHGAPGDLVIIEDRGGDARSGLAGLDRSQLRAVVRGGAPRIADPDLADWFAIAGVDAVPVLLDGKPKLMDRQLADPAVIALEPGLELVAHTDQREPDRVVEVHP